ncbi:uncharacterized protein LOC124370788, partial [Homalodisca vitripennis]|uniref:uncharacterized protein LOC124370788 n=1 Tax=Homalodisca vitripennis TaxID=197043 RepID=UPI001EEAA241
VKNSDYEFDESVNFIRMCARRVRCGEEVGVSGSIQGDWSRFYPPITQSINKASRMLGFVIRTSRKGLSIEAMKTVYVSLVRSVLEFGSVVWSPYQLGQIQRLQRIQDRFVRVVGVRLGFEYLDVPVRAVEEFLGLNPLIVRRQLHDLTFLQRVLVGDLDCPALLRLINIRVPAGLAPRTSSAVPHVLPTMN